jgi:hypothetical protein
MLNRWIYKKTYMRVVWDQQPRTLIKARQVMRQKITSTLAFFLIFSITGILPGYQLVYSPYLETFISIEG